MTEQKSWATDSELDLCLDLHTKAPYVIANVSQSMFSTARHYGGCTFQGETYHYEPTTDELIRSDVLKRIAANRKREAKSNHVFKATNSQQGDLL